MNKKSIAILIILVAITGLGTMVFYYYRKSDAPQISDKPESGDSFIQTAVQAPAVGGNIVNSGIAGKVTMVSGKAFEASLEIFKNGDLSMPFISVRTHSDGTFQVPLKPDSYVLKPTDPDGSIAPVRNSYDFMVGNGQWLQVKIEYR